MAHDLNILRTKAVAPLQAIREMNSQERERLPTAAYAENYNRLHAMVLAAMPQFKDLMPPLAEVIDDPVQGRIGRASFAEFMSYYTEITFLINRGGRHEGPTVIH